MPLETQLHSRHNCSNCGHALYCMVEGDCSNEGYKFWIAREGYVEENCYVKDTQKPKDYLNQLQGVYELLVQLQLDSVDGDWRVNAAKDLVEDRIREIKVLRTA